jgi:hypothetical protein
VAQLGQHIAISSNDETYGPGPPHPRASDTSKHVCGSTGQNRPWGAQGTTAPPPIFPKHRRGIYINNDRIEVIARDAAGTAASIDDPSVPDKGELEINLLTEADLARRCGSVSMFTVDANYGVVLHGWGHDLPTQIKFESPVVARAEHGNPYETASAPPPSV